MSDAGPPSDASDAPARRGNALRAKLVSLTLLANLAGFVVAVFVARTLRAGHTSQSGESLWLAVYYGAMFVVALFDAFLVDELVLGGTFRRTYLQGKDSRQLERSGDDEALASSMRGSSFGFPLVVVLCGGLTYGLFNLVNNDFDTYHRTIGTHISALRSEDPEQQRQAVAELSIRRAPPVLPALIATLQSENEAAPWAAWALGRFEDLPTQRPVITPLVGAARSHNPAVRREALVALGRLQHRPSAPYIHQEIQAQMEAGQTVDPRLLYALGSIQVLDSLPLLEELLHSGDENTQRLAAWALAQHRDQRAKDGVAGRDAVTLLERRLPSASLDVRCAIVHALGILGDEQSNLPLMQAFDMYLRTVVYSAGVAGFSFDTESLRRCKEAMIPVNPITHVFVRTAVGFTDNLLNFNLGRLGTLMSNSARNLAGMNTQRRWLTDEERALTMGGSRFQRALVAARVGSPDALDEIEQLEQLGPRIWAIGGLQARTYYHMWRGESAAAQRMWAKAELEFVRLGALWQLYAIHHSSAAITYAYTDDMLGLRRCIEALTRQVDAGLGFSIYLALARAEHARLRGDHHEALARCDEALAALPPGEGLPRPWALVARADALRGLERWTEAREAYAEAIAHTEDPEYGQNSFRCRAERNLALLDAAQGRREAAVERLDRLIADAEALDNPFILGAAHESRAQIAAELDDEDGVRHHLEQVERCFVPTRNPVLIARYERLRRQLDRNTQAAEAGSSRSDIATTVFNPDTVTDTIGDAMSMLSACRTPDQRAQRALDTLAQSVGNTQAYLYLLRDGEPTLVAPSAGAEPPVAEAWIRRPIRRPRR